VEKDYSEGEWRRVTPGIIQRIAPRGEKLFSSSSNKAKNSWQMKMFFLVEIKGLKIKGIICPNLICLNRHKSADISCHPYIRCFLDQIMPEKGSIYALDNA